jgi:hypothetical protein
MSCLKDKLQLHVSLMNRHLFCVMISGNAGFLYVISVTVTTYGINMRIKYSCYIRMAQDGPKRLAMFKSEMLVNRS